MPSWIPGELPHQLRVTYVKVDENRAPASAGYERAASDSKRRPRTTWTSQVEHPRDGAISRDTTGSSSGRRYCRSMRRRAAHQPRLSRSQTSRQRRDRRRSTDAPVDQLKYSQNIHDWLPGAGYHPRLVPLFNNINSAPARLIYPPRPRELLRRPASPSPNHT